jgi:hypothetical protein
MGVKLSVSIRKSTSNIAHKQTITIHLISEYNWKMVPIMSLIWPLGIYRSKLKNCFNNITVEGIKRADNLLSIKLNDSFKSKLEL